MFNFVNRGCDQPLSPRNTIVENVPPAGPVRVDYVLEKSPGAVYLMPGGLPVKWSWNRGRFTAEIDQVGIHDVLVIETTGMNMRP